MKINKHLLIICIMAAVSLMCACSNAIGPAEGDTGDRETVTNQEIITAVSENIVQESTKDPPFTTSYVSDEMYKIADQWAGCDDRALAKVMRKAENGEHITIACIGGSITQGTISSGSNDGSISPKRCYADIFFNWWREAFPDADFEFINAGIGGTDSYLGVHRVEEEVLSHEPDLVLVEFSVNDGDSLFYKKTYDNLVRKILKAESEPAVMLLLMGQSNGATAQGSHVFVGFGYKLPMLSYASLIKEMISENIYDEKSLSGDVVHPSALGHAIAGEIICKYLGEVYMDRDSFEEPDVFDISPVTKEVYMNAKILDSRNLIPDKPGTFLKGKGCEQFPYGWICSEGEGEITFTASFRNLGVLYMATIDGKGGRFDVFVDGVCVGTIDSDFVGGWGNAIMADEYFKSKEEAEHTVIIRKSPENDDAELKLLGFLIS